MKARKFVLLAMVCVVSGGAFGFDPVAAPTTMLYFEKRFGADSDSTATAGIRFDVRGAGRYTGARGIEPVPALMDLRLAGSGHGPVLLLSGIPLWQPARVFWIEGTAVPATGGQKTGNEKLTAGDVAKGLLGLVLLGSMSAYAMSNAETDEEKVETALHIINALGS